MEFIDTFEKHKNESEKSLDDYFKELRLKLGKEMNNKIKIYLDTKYWIYLRDYIMGRNKDKNIKQIYELLHEGVDKDKLICPVSDAIFYEITQQTDSSTLKETVALIDSLSKGITIISSIERIKFEILYFIYSLNGWSNNLYSPDEFVWTKVSYLLGLTSFESKLFSREDERVIQKAFVDQMWTFSLTDIIDKLGMEALLRMPRINDISKQLNVDKVKYSHENNSFKQIFMSEVAGILDVIKPDIQEMLVYIYKEQFNKEPDATELESFKSEEMFANVIYNVVDSNKIGLYLPTLIIIAKLHAGVRLDIQRKYRKNDQIDFQHASAALPYFDYFFTERSLMDLIKRKNINLQNVYHCRVFARSVEVLESLKSINC